MNDTSFQDDMYHQERMTNLIVEQKERMNNLALEQKLIPFSTLKPKIHKDGNQWCVLLGENIQEGVVGFGDTPMKAILAWNEELHKANEL